jgi:hypothetical protein
MVDLDLPDLARRIAGAGPVVLSEADAEAATGSNGHASEAIAELVDAERLAVRDGPDGTPWLHLTTAAAAVLELDSAPDVKGIDRWWQRGEVIPQDLPSSRRQYASETIGDRADPGQPEPWQELSATDPDPDAFDRFEAKLGGNERAIKVLEAWKRERAKSRNVPTPTIIRLGSAAWPPPERSDGACPVCEGLPMPRLVACGWCTASGVDDLLPEVLPSERPKDYDPDAVQHDDKFSKLAGGMGTAHGMDSPTFMAMMAVLEVEQEEYRKKRHREQAEARKKAKAKADRKFGGRPKKTG